MGSISFPGGKMSVRQQNHLADQILFNKQTSERFQLLLKNISGLSRAVELQAVFKESLYSVKKVMEAEASSLLLFDNSSGELIVSMPTGEVRQEIKREHYKKGGGIVGWVLKKGKPYFSNDLENEEIIDGDTSGELKIRNIICVPLADRNGEIFGVLQALNRSNGRDFYEQDILIFQTLAEHVASAVERSREHEQLHETVKKREMMLTEIHHRLKNNLSTITALIELEISDINDRHAKDTLLKTCSRMESMTEIHDLLHNTGASGEIDLKPYLERLTKKITNMLLSPSRQVEVKVEAESIQLDSERALSCGLLVNELIVNSFKHAFEQPVTDAQILVAASLSDDHYVTLRVSDNGKGIGEYFELGDSGSVGSWLIEVLLRRLEATVDITGSDGTSFTIRFKQ